MQACLYDGSNCCSPIVSFPLWLTSKRLGNTIIWVNGPKFNTPTKTSARNFRYVWNSYPFVRTCSPLPKPNSPQFTSPSNIIPLLFFSYQFTLLLNCSIANRSFLFHFHPSGISSYLPEISAPMDQTEQTLGAVPQSTATTNWTINVSDTKTIKVSNVSLSASEEDIKEFFSFSGDIKYVEMQRESETTNFAYVTFKETQEADTAMLLSGATISGLSVTISPSQDYQLPPDAFSTNVESETDSGIKKAEDVVSTMLAKGFVLGKDAVNKAKAFDEQHHLTSNASATLTSIDRKMGLTEKLNMGTSIVNDKWKEMDQRFQVSEKTKSAYSVAEQKASTAGSALMSNRYVLTGATWVTSAYNRVTKAAEDVSTRTKEKVERAEGEKNDVYEDKAQIISDFAQANSDHSPAGKPPVVPFDSKDSKLGNI